LQQQVLKAPEDRRNCKALISPMHGTVNMRSSSSVGGMTRSAEQIVQINSRIERAVIEARIKPEGIAGVKSAQDATIQPAACSYWITVCAWVWCRLCSCRHVQG